MSEEPLSLDFLNLTYESSDGSTVLKEYIEQVANKKLLAYKHIIHTGGKRGESLWTHIINLATVIEKLRPLFPLSGDEMRCLLLALTIHDLNKVSLYGKQANGKSTSYANAASRNNIAQALEQLEVEAFFPEWRAYLADIVYLAHSHQEGTETVIAHDQRLLNQCQLDQGRLTGLLKELMKAADVSDNSHSGEYTTRHEKHIRDKLLGHINAALNEECHSHRYRFVGHRLAELRGLITNVVHNIVVAYMRERYKQDYGPNACIDLLYHPEGVDYLLDKRIPLTWTAQDLHTVAERIGQKLAKLQLEQISQFIKAKPSGINVDDAAIESGASLSAIFMVIQNTVENKRYRLEWRAERNALVRADLEAALHNEHVSAELKEQIMLLLQESDLVPVDEEALKRGEFVTAYRNFLKSHHTDQLNAIKEDAWQRVARLFHLPETSYALALFVDPYRRGYFMGRDLPVKPLETMTEEALADLQQLELQVAQAQASRREKKEGKVKGKESKEAEQLVAHTTDATADISYLIDYLERHLEVWDSATVTAERTLERSIPVIDFGESLRRYADPKRPHTQCCYCGSALKAEEWMAIQVPPSIGVQSFSNRLEGGSARDPKRNVCPVCRTQFILEKLAWRSHRDKQGSEQITFYLHLFPYSFFTQPLLQAWWQSLERLRDQDHTALFLDTKNYFLKWEQAYLEFQQGLPVGYYRSFTEGVGIPTLSEALSNTPVLPLIVPGSGYGKQFLVALEKATLMAQWFDCRVLLSRMPVPLLNLASERIDDEPVALQIEAPPRVMNWLVPRAALTRPEVDTLCHKLSLIHQLVYILVPMGDEQFETAIYDLITAAADDPLALYYETDRLIEQRAAHNKQKSKKELKAEHQAIQLSQRVAPLLEKLTNLEKEKNS
jgi:CRISPR-associated protein Csc3